MVSEGGLRASCWGGLVCGRPSALWWCFLRVWVGGLKFVVLSVPSLPVSFALYLSCKASSSLGLSWPAP